jgi:hypothetical protein
VFACREILPALLVLFLFKHIPRTDAPYYVHGMPTHAVPADENAGLLAWQQAAAAAPAVSINYGEAWPSAHPYSHTGIHSPYAVPSHESPSPTTGRRAG